jgi:hypothetical protein
MTRRHVLVAALVVIAFEAHVLLTDHLAEGDPIEAIVAQTDHVALLEIVLLLSVRSLCVLVLPAMAAAWATASAYRWWLDREKDRAAAPGHTARE